MTIGNNGNVGIGTTSPGLKLHVASATGGTGGIKMTSGVTNAQISITDGNQNLEIINYNTLDMAGVAQIQFFTNNDVATPKMVIHRLGNVGIGTTGPQAPLNVYKAPTSGFVESFRVGGTNNYRSLDMGTWGAYDAYISTYGNDLHILAGRGVASENHNIKFYTGFSGTGGAAESNQRMIIRYNGNVGIGTTSPLTKLEITHDGASTHGHVLKINQNAIGNSDGPKIEFYKTMATSKRWSIGFLNGVNVDDFVISEDGGSGAGFGTPRLTVQAGGNVGIGDTTPDAKLDVAGTGYFDNSGTYTTTYAWAGSTLQTNSLEIMDRYAGSTSDGIYPTLTFHDYGRGGPQFSFEGATAILHLGSASANSAGTIATAGAYFSELRVHGNVYITGSLSKASGSFLIDHPLDPSNKVLRHSFIESPDMKNIYDGVVVLDENGEKRIELPDYFEALNKDFRYQSTPIGAPAALFIKEEIKDNSFVVAGGEAGMKVSWQVTGTRKDAFALKNPIVVEQEKGTSEGLPAKGEYLHPDCFE